MARFRPGHERGVICPKPNGSSKCGGRHMSVEIRIVLTRRQWDFITCPADIILFGKSQIADDSQSRQSMAFPEVTGPPIALDLN